jgi:hypothetical protein
VPGLAFVPYRSKTKYSVRLSTKFINAFFSVTVNSF